MNTFVLFVLVVQIILVAKELYWGVCFYIFIRLLIPSVIRIGDISLNTVLLLIIYLFILFKYRSGLVALFKNSSIKAIIIFCFGLLFCVFLAPLPYAVQLSSLIQFIITEILPCIAVFIILKNEKQLKLFIYTILVSLLIAGTYGLYTYIIKSNPYYMYMVLNYGDPSYLIYDISEITREKGELTGYAAGMSSPAALIWSQITLLGGMFFWNHKIYNKSIVVSVSILMILNSFLSGQRSSLIAFIIGLIILYLYKINFKLLIKFIILLISIVLALSFVPSLSKYKTTLYASVLFWHDDFMRENNITGSSFDMRVNQFKSTIEMLFSYPLAGKGFGYPTSEYAEKDRSTMYGFESIFFNVAWSSGILGCFVWLFLFLKLYKYQKIEDTAEEMKRFRAFFLAYVVTITLTAIQSTFFLFLIFVVLFQKEHYLLKEYK